MTAPHPPSRAHAMALPSVSLTPRLHAGLAVLRATVGMIFIAHGGQKLFVTGMSGVIGGLGLALTMLGAIFLVHLPAGFFAPEGIGFSLALLGGSLTLALNGPGDISLDRRLSRRGPSASTHSR